ncbi:MAG: 50S ribosomal protein L9 [Candidatus Jorgensenbacteria bacterium]|nr:50S ribosomal protein L9 [Candidatus Jorgensenbacteria bacterium]
MKVILLKEIRGLGHKGDVKEVKEGYARNLLMPQKLAEIATPAALARASEEKARIEKNRAEKTAELKKSAESIKNTTLIFKMKTGEKGKVFGSITDADIRNALSEKGFNIPIASKHHIKTTGEHILDIDLGDGIKTKLRVLVEPEA